MRFLPLLLSLLLSYSVAAQCPESTITVNIQTDQFPQDNRWTLTDLEGTIIEEHALFLTPALSFVTWDVCVPDDQCLVFTITDSFGDGFIDTVGAYFEVLRDGELVIPYEPFNTIFSTNINCPPGQACNTSEVISEGTFQTTYDDQWYLFSPEATGQYLITTCGLNDCDTKIWVYENCQGMPNEDNSGTILYDDDFGGCGVQAEIIATMETDLEYFIRIGDDSGACPDNDVQWSINFMGAISGCTDSTSCNYNPVATVDDGSCLMVGDPDCPQGPDLVLDQNILRTSMYLTTIDTNNNCFVQEGCLQGYGLRDIIRFNTTIANIGEFDYYIGLKDDNSGQFTFDNCHNHWHYDGYAEYLLYDEIGQKIPIGFKNGFCVIDLGCTTGTKKYDCTNMGISAGCYDSYWAGIDCQWIDITDVPDGNYTFVARVNWDNAPDALGQVEKDSINNWAQACITLDRSSGALTFVQNPDCPEFEDCAGVPFGNTEIDCEGNCGGLALMGDLNTDASQSSEDLNLYAAGILADDLAVTSCNDLTADGILDIYDVSLLASCLSYGGGHVHPDTGPHDHCEFPQNIIASTEASTLEIINGVANEYFDVGITNPDSRVIGYQFELSGVNISNVENLVNPSVFNHPVMMDPITNMVMSFATDTTFIDRSTAVQPLVRIYYNEQNSPEICIENIQGIINWQLERVPSMVTGPCLFVTSNIEALASTDLSILPNPTAGLTALQLAGGHHIYGWELADIHGRIFSVGKIQPAPQLDIDLSELPSGLYFVKLNTSAGVRLGKVVRH